MTCIEHFIAFASIAVTVLIMELNLRYNCEHNYLTSQIAQLRREKSGIDYTLMTLYSSCIQTIMTLYTAMV